MRSGQERRTTEPTGTASIAPRSSPAETAFVAVADELSFSKAAQRLFITQPALSRQIRGLERLVGCDLFRRSTQRVDLTLAGESLLGRARTLLADLDDALQDAMNAYLWLLDHGVPCHVHRDRRRRAGVHPP